MSISAVSGPSSTSTTNTHPEARPANTPPPSSRKTAQETVNISNAGQQAAKSSADSDSDSDSH
jgi:hypothetical protein